MMNKFPPKKKANTQIIRSDPNRVWSEYQRAIFKDIAQGTGHTVVMALAGSGKTSTIIEGFKYVPPKTKTLMVAFNKDIVAELKARAPSYIEVRTVHSLGFQAIKNTFGKHVVLDEKKCQKIVSSIIGDDNDLWEINISICKCVSLCKASLIDTPTKISDVIDQYGIDTFDMSRDVFIGNVVRAMAACKVQKDTVDYDDMCWFVFVHRLNVGKFDFIFCDEVQDFNRLQTYIALSACKTHGRIIAVGDVNQAIYLFRGADSQAIPYIIEKLKAKTLPLSITYRCPKSVVKLAQEVVPAFQAAPNAIEGKIIDLQVNDLLKTVKPGDFIISRTNAPLIKYCLLLLKNGVPANIRGRDIGANLLYFVKKSKAKKIDKFIDYVIKWRDAEIDRLTKERKDATIPADKAECLLNLCEGCFSIEELKETIEKLFGEDDDSKKVILGTTHKLKGLERDRVFVLANTYRKGADQENTNLWYVAISRAKKELYLVYKDGKKQYHGANRIDQMWNVALNGEASTLAEEQNDDIRHNMNKMTEQFNDDLYDNPLEQEREEQETMDKYFGW